MTDCGQSLSLVYELRREITRLLRQANARLQTDALEMNADTLGTEYWLAIAVEASGPQVSFACLAEPTYLQARGATLRGSTTSVLATPLGKLMAHGLFGHGATRGVDVSLNYQMRLLPWITEPSS